MRQRVYVLGCCLCTESVLCFHRLGTKCSLVFAAVKMFVYHHQSAPPGLATLFWRPSQKIPNTSALFWRKGLFIPDSWKVVFWEHKCTFHYLLHKYRHRIVAQEDHSKGKKSLWGCSHLFMGFFFQTMAELMLVGRSKQCPRDAELAGSQTQPESLYRSYSALASEPTVFLSASQLPTT